MFFPNHPKPVRPRKAVPEQQVSSQQFAQVDTKTIVVERSSEELLSLQSKIKRITSNK